MTLFRTVHTLCTGLCLATLLTLPSTAILGADQPDASRRILLITGEDYPGHKWRETTPVLLAKLSADPRLTVDVLADLKSLASERLDDYDAVILHFRNYDPEVPGRKGFDNLDRYVKQGGGLMILHFACGAFQEFKDDFESLAGRVWFGWTPPPSRFQHDPRGQFTVNIANTDHPITNGLEDFDTVDELYACLEGDNPITTLATAVSKLDGKTYPIAFVLQSGKGRVFHCVLGHDVEAFSGTEAAELMRRGCVWISGLEPITAKQASQRANASTR